MRKQIKLLASEYEVGDQTELIECPACGGGHSNEKSFTMQILPEGVVYICYRASCGIKGFVPNLRMGEMHVKPKQKQPKPFTCDESPLPEMMIPFLTQKFPCMTAELLNSEGVMYSHERKRILVPMFDARGYRFGLIARSYEIVPKAIAYHESYSVPNLHFPLCYKPSQTVVLVEDQFSAMILCDQGIPTIALMGTHLSEEYVTHLANLGIQTVAFYLDADAVHKAIKFRNEYSLEFKTALYYHELDPKDLNHDQIQELKQWMSEI